MWYESILYMYWYIISYYNIDDYAMLLTYIYMQFTYNFQVIALLEIVGITYQYVVCKHTIHVFNDHAMLIVNFYYMQFTYNFQVIALLEIVRITYQYVVCKHTIHVFNGHAMLIINFNYMQFT